VIFVDTGAFLARCVARDQHHDEATERWRWIAENGFACATSSFVLDETITLLMRRTEPGFALRQARSLYANRSLTVLRPDEADELDALEWLRRFADQQVSFTDCVSFVLMKRHRLKRAFGFDRHFSLAGFELLP
jgi:uncharacterized protein